MNQRIIDAMKKAGVDYIDTDAKYAFVEKGRGAFRTDFMEAIEILCKNISSDVQTSVHGKAHAHYNKFTDVLEVTISNRVLNVEPFRYHYYNLSRDMKNHISSEVIARFVVKEYHDYVDMYIFKRY